MQIKSLRVISYRSWRVDDKKYLPEAEYRLQQLNHFQQLKSEGCSESTALAVLGISRATYYRWKDSYKQSGKNGLESKSCRPQQRRCHTWDKALEQQVLALRKRYPMWGKLKLAELIRREYGKTVAVSTVGRILKKLKNQGKIRSVSYYYGHTRQRRARSFHGHSQRWRQGMKSRKPGELIQIDHMKVYPQPGKCIMHFKATCPVTKITIAQAYSRATSRCAMEFLLYLQQQLPFPVGSIQVDGGSEFRSEFEDTCRQQNIPLYVLPPRSPEKNGQVERGNSTFKYEFYFTYQGSCELKFLRVELHKYVSFYNQFRPHQALNQMTPMAYFSSHFQEAFQSHTT
jgi:putative transposase